MSMSEFRKKVASMVEWHGLDLPYKTRNIQERVRRGEFDSWLLSVPHTKNGASYLGELILLQSMMKKVTARKSLDAALKELAWEKGRVVSLAVRGASGSLARYTTERASPKNSPMFRWLARYGRGTRKISDYERCYSEGFTRIPDRLKVYYEPGDFR